MNICYSYNKERKVERYENHIKSAVAAWSVIKPYYEKVLDRVLGKLEFDPIAVAWLFMTLGSLQTRMRRVPGTLGTKYLVAMPCIKFSGKDLRM